MAWEINSDRPVYIQLMEEIERRIISGVYKAGDKVPAVRELAVEAAVNPNTMQKALSELERNGLIFSHRTSGRFVTEDESLIKTIRAELSDRITSEYIDSMRKLGLSDEEILQAVNNNK